MAAVVAGGGTAGVLVASADAAPTCTFNWTGLGADGDWGDPLNWSTTDTVPPSPLVPGSSDVACFSGATVTVESTDVGDTADSIQGGTLVIDSGSTLTLTSASDASTLDALTISGGTPAGGVLDGAGASLTVSGNFIWGDGTAGSATLDDVALAASTVSMASTPTIDGGSLSVGSAVSLSPNLTVSGSPTLSTTGAMTVSNVTGSGATFSAAGGVADGNTAATPYGVGSNTLDLTGGATTVASGDTLEAGSVNLSGGTLQDDGAISAPVTLTGGTLSGAGSVGGSLTNTSGTVSPGDGTTPGTLSVSGNYSQTGGTLAITLDGATAGTGYAQLAVAGASLGGTLSLTTGSGFTGTGFQVLTSTSLSNTFATVANEPSGFVPQYASTGVTLTAVPASCSGLGSFDGYIGPSGGDWSTDANWSTGLPPTGSQVACWDTGTAVTVSTGTATADSIKSTGALDITGGTLTLAGPTASTLDTLDLAGGELDGPSGETLTISGLFTWGDGASGTATLNDSGGDMTINAPSATIDSTSTPTFDGGSLSVPGPVSLPSNFTVSGSPTLTTTSGGAITVNSNIGGSGATFSAAGGVLNGGAAGTYGFGTNTLDLPGGTTTVAGGSTLAAGTINLSGGTLQDDGAISGAVTLTGGTLEGTGSVSGAVANTSGTVSPGDAAPGTLTVGGAYSQGSGATLAIELNSISAFSKLAVTGTATVAGKLTLSGSYAPVQGNTFEVLTYASRVSGTLTVGGTDASDYIVGYGATGLTLAVTPSTCPTTGSYDAYTGPSGPWSTASNWSTGAVPTGTEVACWAAGTTVTVTTAESVDSIQAGGNLDLTGAALDLTSGTDNSSVDDLSLAGRNITGAGQTLTASGITETGTSSVSGPVLHLCSVTDTAGCTASQTSSVTGTLTVGTLNTDSGTTLGLTGALSVNNGTIAGTISGTGGTFTGGATGGTTTIAATTGGLATAYIGVGSGQLTVDGGYAAAYGTTVGSGTLALSTGAPTTYDLSWTGGGTLSLGDGDTLLVAGDLTLTDGGTVTLGDSGTLVNVLGDFDWASGTVSPNGGTIATTGTDTLGSGADTNGSGAFSASSVAESGVTGSYGFGSSSLTLAGGTTTVASGNTLTSGPVTLQGGTLEDDGHVAASVTVTEGGTLDGTGTVGGAVTNTSGTVSPGDAGPGTLTVTGNYSQAGGATLAIELDGTTAGSNFGVLAVGGTSTLGGDLSLADENGFVPVSSDTFNVLTSVGTRTGAVTLTGTSADVYVVSYSTHDVTLGLNPVPANTQAPSISGTPSVGQTLTCSGGSWSADPGTPYAYQWNRNGSPISGATGTTYVVVTADQGTTLTCTVTATNSFGSGHAVSAAVSIPAPPSAPIAPFNITAPSVTGTATPGDQLSCSSGVWLESPTAYTYVWERNGSPISGATGSTYKVQVPDQVATITCVVTASNAGGAGAPKTSNAIIVALPGTLSCAKPTGKLSGRSLGAVQLGFTRSRARRAVKKYKATGSTEDAFCLYGGWGINAGYPSTKLLRTLPRSERGRLKGRIVLALTSSIYYSLNGAVPGMTVASVAKKLHLGKVIRIGANDWYIAPGSASTGVLRVRGGIIQEVGIATKAFLKTRADQTRFLKDFNGA